MNLSVVLTSVCQPFPVTAADIRLWITQCFPAQRTTALLQVEAILPSGWGLQWGHFTRLSITPRPARQIYVPILISIVLFCLLSPSQQSKLWFPLSSCAAAKGQ